MSFDYKSKKLLTSCLCLALMLFPLPTSAQTTQANVALFQSCEEDSASFCIENLSIVLPSGKEIAAKKTNIVLNDNFQAGTFWRASGEVPVYEFPGVKFGFGSGKVLVRGFYWPDGEEYCAYGTCTLHNETMILYLVPYAPNVSNPMFLTESTFKLSIQADSKFQPVTSTGRAKNVKISSLPKTFTQISRPLNSLNIQFSPILLQQTDFSSNDPASFDRALYNEDIPTMWLFGNNSDQSKRLGPCVLSGGVLSSYSNAISMDLPVWNKSQATIDVWTKSPHLTKNGDINLGYLEAQVPIPMAKCLWNVSLEGKFEGKISMTYADGSQPEIVTMTGSLSGNDYSLKISGYHYSAPTFHIFLDKSMQNPIKRISITCVKGKISRKVTAVNPKCPSGYKRVA